jgi:hypothetical protein
MQRAASKYLRASQLEEIGDLTKEMMFNKYDDMKESNDQNNGKVKTTFSVKAAEHRMLNGKDSVTLVKNGTL